MLEARIEELTKAVQALTKALESTPGESVSYGEAQAFNSEKEMVQAIVKPEVPNEKSSLTTSTSQPSSPESAPVTYDDIKKLVIAISKESRDKAAAALQRLGVTSAKHLETHQWPAAVAYLTKVAAGEVDPESAHE